MMMMTLLMVMAIIISMTIKTTVMMLTCTQQISSNVLLCHKRSSPPQSNCFSLSHYNIVSKQSLRITTAVSQFMQLNLTHECDSRTSLCSLQQYQYHQVRDPLISQISHLSECTNIPRRLCYHRMCMFCNFLRFAHLIEHSHKNGLTFSRISCYGN